MCETGDGGCVVDFDEALRKFGGAARLQFRQELDPEMDKREPLFLATGEISRPIVVTSEDLLVNVRDRSKESVLCVSSYEFVLFTMSSFI
jgi:hypothetical protein